MHKLRNSEPDPVKRMFHRTTLSEDPDGCFVCSYATGTPGYPQVSVNNWPVRSHRLSWEYFFGPIPEEKCVLHHCDNKRCIRPDHLFLGTISDNTKDMMEKGKGVMGEAVHSSKLTEEDVREIRRLLSEGVRPTRIAEVYMISQSHVSGIKAGKFWKHLK